MTCERESGVLWHPLCARQRKRQTGAQSRLGATTSDIRSAPDSGSRRLQEAERAFAGSCAQCWIISHTHARSFVPYCRGAAG